MVGLFRRATPSSRARTARAPGRGRRGRGHSVLGVRSVVGQMFLLQVALVVLLALAAIVGLVLLARVDSRQEASNRSLAVAEGLANSPGMVEALRSSHPDAILQPRAEAARKGSGVDFVVVMSPDGKRYTHPDPSRIGERFLGTIAPARAGGVVKETYTGTLGPSARAVVPVKAPDGTVVGLVAAGITMNRINSVVDRELPVVVAGAGVAILLAMGCAALISRRLLRQTHGMGPAEITRMYEHHDAVLHSVREGVLIVDEDRRLLLANDEALRLLELPQDAQGRRVTELGLDPVTTELLTSGREASDEVHLAGGRLLAVNHRPIDRLKGPPGTVATLRDSTELRALSGKAETARERLRLLYDASVRIGTTLEVRRTAEELVQVAVPRFADFVTVDLAEPVMHGEEPGGPEMDMRRVACGGVRDDSPLYRTGQLISYADATPQLRSLIAGKAVIVPDLRAMGEWRTQDPERSERITGYGIHSLIAAPLLARGAVLGVASFWRRGEPEPYDEDDLSLARELATRTAVCVDNARRYTREHTMAVTLQRSLLPRGLPEQSALDAAYRYLPAKAGVGGDWFDVIPLPGARVALVVGDVVGHGLHAAATMGRLRTAVHNFSALDLPPDELLSHLDELVDRIDREATADGSGSMTGATCLYAVYDPAARTCVAARAGHLPPALVLPDGKVEFPELPAGPPLGVGGLPFETATLEIPEGSRLVLYTDGLVECRDRDIGAGLELLRESLARSGDDPEETCATVLKDLLPTRPADDVALLVARTKVLGPGRTAQWDVPRDPAAVRQVRSAVTERLTEWNMEETAFLTELVLTELVTNAIRHATGPIGVRLMRDTALICEVSDGSSTSPHLRYATGTDEGGRGLFLVAQFADRWGTRYTPEGKVIWAELPLPKSG